MERKYLARNKQECCQAITEYGVRCHYANHNDHQHLFGVRTYRFDTELSKAVSNNYEKTYGYHD